VRRAALGALALGLACTSGPERDGRNEASGLGRRIHEGVVHSLAASADGAWIAFLDGCAEARAAVLPPGTASCDLRVVPAAGGEARRVARSVTTLPHGYAWHPRADLLAALAEYDYVQGTGQLVAATGAGPATPVAEGVSFHGFVPGDERVAAVSGGRLVAAKAGGQLNLAVAALASGQHTVVAHAYDNATDDLVRLRDGTCPNSVTGNYCHATAWLNSSQTVEWTVTIP